MTVEQEHQHRMAALVKALLDATRAGKITWTVTDSETRFLYAGTRSSVTIAYNSGYSDDETALSLLNDKGVVVDSIATEFRRGPSADTLVSADWNQDLEDLYAAARRFAHNVDEALDSMLQDIAKGTPSPPRPSKRRTSDDPWSDEPPF